MAIMTERAQGFIESNWNSDAAAVEETARRGYLAEADLEDLKDKYPEEQFRDEWKEVALEVVETCRALRPDVPTT